MTAAPSLFNRGTYCAAASIGSSNCVRVSFSALISDVFRHSPMKPTRSEPNVFTGCW
ncbi:MAG TPA: hypothetical protein VKD69_26910 [Vicinamibacterales bacterium]|nr:hypothetical protein [Vicinamibacterales bacterium]